MLGYWPGSAVHQRQTLAVPRYEDFEYSSFDQDDELDSLAWMGNGMIMAQTQGRSTTGYLDDVDVPPTPTPAPAPHLIMHLQKSCSSTLYAGPGPSTSLSQDTDPFSMVEEVPVAA